MEKVKDYLDGLLEGYIGAPLEIDVYTNDYKNFGTLILYDDGCIEFQSDDMENFTAPKNVLYTVILSSEYFATKELKISTRIEGTYMFKQSSCCELYLSDFTLDEWKQIINNENIEFYKNKFNLETLDGVKKYADHYVNNCSLVVLFQ